MHRVKAFWQKHAHVILFTETASPHLVTRRVGVKLLQTKEIHGSKREAEDEKIPRSWFGNFLVLMGLIQQHIQRTENFGF